MPFQPPGDCPVCGEEVPAGVPACPGCGACSHSGWREEEDEDGFDYEDFVRKEFSPAPKPAISFAWWLAAFIVLIIFVWIVLG